MNIRDFEQGFCVYILKSPGTELSIIKVKLNQIQTRPLPRYVSPAEYRRGRNTTLKFFPFA